MDLARSVLGFEKWEWLWRRWRRESTEDVKAASANRVEGDFLRRTRPVAIFLLVVVLGGVIGALFGFQREKP